MEIKKNKPFFAHIYIYVSLLYTVLFCLPKSLIFEKIVVIVKTFLGAIDKFVARSAK